jgi:hypothetical protein
MPTMYGFRPSSLFALIVLDRGKLRSALFNELLRSSPPPFENEIEVWPFNQDGKAKTSVTQVALKAAGLFPSEIQAGPLVDTLFDFNAVELTSGPFDMESTRDPAEHLTFGGTENHRILRILCFDEFLKLVRVQVSGAAR